MKKPVLFTRFHANSMHMINDIYALDPESGSEVCLAGRASGDRIPIDNACPRYNGDKSMIAFLSTRNNPFKRYNVFILDLAAGTERQLTTGELDMASVDWAADDSRLVVSCKDASGGLQVHLLDRDGISLVQLTTGPSESAGALWSPRGDRIVCTRFPPRGGSSHIWIMDPDGNNALQLTTAEAAHSNPSWSPDGSWIVFRCDLGRPHLRKINIDTGELIVFPPPPSGADSSPVWSGSEIVFSSSRDWEDDDVLFNLYRMTAEGENVRRLTVSPTFEYCGDW